MLNFLQPIGKSAPWKTPGNHFRRDYTDGLAFSSVRNCLWMHLNSNGHIHWHLSSPFQWLTHSSDCQENLGFPLQLNSVWPSAHSWEMPLAVHWRPKGEREGDVWSMYGGMNSGGWNLSRVRGKRRWRIWALWVLFLMLVRVRPWLCARSKEFPEHAYHQSSCEGIWREWDSS